MKKLNTVIAAMTLAVMGSANAGQITSWTYINEAGFTSPVGATASGDATPNGVLSGAASTTLTWGQGWSNGAGGPYINGGVDGRQSSLTSISPVDGTITTNGGLEQGTDLVHNNWVVGFAGGTLTSASFLDGLSLIPATIDGFPIPDGSPLKVAFPAPELDFDLEFIETPNFVNYGITGGTVANNNAVDGTKICPDGTANGVGVNLKGCADIFAISSTGGVVFTQVGDNLEISNQFPLTIDGETFSYTVTTILSGLTLISDQACIAVGLGSGCNGFVTPEEQINTLTAMFKIESTFIPVKVASPSTLAIFGLGLIGLGGLARRKANK